MNVNIIKTLKMMLMMNHMYVVRMVRVIVACQLSRLMRTQIIILMMMRMMMQEIG